MLLKQSISDLRLKSVTSTASRLPELSLQHRQAGQLSGAFQWSALVAEDWLMRDRRLRWYGVGMLAVVALHVGVIWWLFAHSEEPVKPPEPTPMTVSLITLPAKKEETPAPEVVPVIKQKPVIKPVVKPKETPVKPVERPTPVVERIVETAPDQPRFEASTQEAPPPMEAPAAAAPAKVTPAAPAAPPKEVVEEKEEPPKFGVAYLNNPAPEYPRLSKRAGEEGRVLLKVLVSVEGRPESVEISKSSGFERLDNAALNAVKQWRFEPARKGGKALSAFVIVPLTFTLN